MDLEELADIAGREMRKHGLRDWTFALADTKRRLGACKHRARRIEIGEFTPGTNRKLSSWIRYCTRSPTPSPVQ